MNGLSWDEVNALVLKARETERQHILTLLQERYTDLSSCSKDDNCHTMAEIIPVIISDIKGEE
jgi:hypothetical protein